MFDKRSRGRPRRECWNEIEEDIKAVKAANWKTMCKKRRDWKKFTNTARTHDKL